ncbi:hypothetical protein K4F52_002046 [Lecanicillium sp. MT-2017a]|nr:hypothetical protein K4F52_002046 [Lecanicillium sp. MT-2017a]
MELWKMYPTHSHPLTAKNLSLGRLPTGDAMVERDVGGPAPFKYVTIEEATADLPDIHDSKPDICVPFPDHRVSIGQTKVVSARLRLIPKQPYGMSFAKAWYGETPGSKEPGSGVLTPAERSTYRNVPGEFSSVMHAAGQNSNAYGRVYPNRPISTVTTVPVPGDAKVGRILHWEEDRVMTIMEARRAQGIRDDEVILGSPQVQYKIVGNSVAREVAVALGAVLRDAYAESYMARQQRTMESHSSEGGLIKVCMEDLSDLVMTDSADDTGVITTNTGKYPSPTVESDVVVETVEIERKRRRSSEAEVPSPSKKKHQMSRFN